MADAVPSPSGQVKAGTYEDVVEELRERFDYATDQWEDIRDEGKTDMRYVAGDPWDPTDRRQREDAGRPVLSLDELGQYVNQLINEVRQHKRAIHVTPMGSGANDQTAEFRANLIRQIEYRSNAQQAYTCLFENAVQRSYGFLRVKAQPVKNPTKSGGDGSAFHYELLIEAVQNPDTVTIDPDCYKPDGKGMQFAFVTESWSLKDYKRKFPKAKVQDFDPTLAKLAPTWMQQGRIQLAEYWRIEVTPRNLLLLQARDRQIEIFEDDLDSKPEFQPFQVLPVLKDRTVDVPTVMSYLTNGFEILETPKVWPGQSIPIVPCYGKVLFVDDGEGSQRKILSLVRLARDPYMLYCYYRTCEAELVGMTPKIPYFVRRGSLAPDQLLNLQKSLHEPIAVIEVEGSSQGMPAGAVPEMPTRNPFTPDIGALEVGAEGARRAIQAAMGTSPLPTSAQRRNEKSGVALQEMRNAEQVGSFHFVDNYEMSITRTGAILDELLDAYYDTARTVTTRDKADAVQQVRINDQDPQRFPEGQTAPVQTGVGDHDATLSTGPAFDSEREEAAAFADHLVANIAMVAEVAGPPVAAKLLALTIRLKNVGPLGDEMADLISPKQEQGQPDPAQLQAKLQQTMQMNQELMQALQQAQRKQDTDEVKAQRDVALEELKQRGEMQRMMVETDLALKKLDLEHKKIEADLLKTRATLEVTQTEAMIDAEVQQTNAAVAQAGEREARQDAAQQSDKDRAFQADQAERGRQADAEQAAVATSQD